MKSFLRYLKNLAKAMVFDKKRVQWNSPEQQDPIDANTLLQKYTVEELCKHAEIYHQHITNWDHHLGLPFSSLDSAPGTLIAFAHLIEGLKLVPGLKILDFAAGSCWASHLLNQLGCEVISLDASKTALNIGRELTRRHAVFGKQPSHTFMEFDGRRIQLPDNSLDRLICINALHHVPNIEEVLSEIFRVLKNGTIAGFSEPGPFHSRSPQSQYEMKNYTVIERDIVIEEIDAIAKQVGFTDLKIALYTPYPMLCSLHEFQCFLGNHGFISPGDPSLEYAKFTVSHMMNHRLFFLYKGAPLSGDSRDPEGLIADILTRMPQTVYQSGDEMVVEAAIKNMSEKEWLPASAGIGGVTLCAHLFDSDGTLLELVYFRMPLTQDSRNIMPGEAVTLNARIPAPPPGKYTLEFDVVSELVTWFSINGSLTTRHGIEVR